MELDIEDTLYRIINGYFYIEVNNTNYKIVMPGIEQKYQAHCFYKDILSNNKYSDHWLSDETIKKLLTKYDIWNDNKEQDFKKILEALDKSKIEYYLNFNTVSKKDQIKSMINNLNNSINKAYVEKHHFDHLTLEYYAQNMKNQYLIYTMVYKDNARVFNDTFESIDSNYLHEIIAEIHNNTLGNEDIKAVARHDLWKSYWTSNKDNVFGTNIRNLTDEQRSLINFSRTLDAIREHLEAPTEEIINDNDALDGWLLYQNDKSIKEKKQKIITEKYGLDKKDVGEVFVMTNNKEEMKEIYSLNDNQTNKDIKNMQKLALNNIDKSIPWSEVPHVKRELQQQAMTMQKDRLKG